MKKAPYELMADAIRSAIDNGEYEPGVQLPGALELAAPHGIRSQDTALKALRMLEREGYLTLERRKPARVRQRPQSRLVIRDRHAYRDELGYYFDQNAKDWRAIGTPQRTIGVPPTHISDLLGEPRGDDVIVRDRAMGPPDSDQALQLATSYIPLWAATAIPALRAERPGPGGIYDRIEEHYKQAIEWGEQNSARLPTADEQQRLSLSDSSPVLVVTRTSTVQVRGRPRVIEINETRVSAEQFAVSYTVIRDDTAAWPREERS